MRFPKLKPQSAKRLSVPDLAGGLNLRDGVSEVLDNQLTQAKNVWWTDGVLKTRPGVKTLSETHVNWITSKQNVSSKLWPEVKYKLDGNEYVLTVIKKDQYLDNTGYYETTLKFYWQGKNETLNICSLNFNEQVSYFVTQNKGVIYLFASNRKIYMLGYSKDNESNQFVLVTEKDYHVPLVATNCKTNGSMFMSSEQIMSSGVAYEGFNILSDYYKISYNAYNPDIAVDEKHKMKYFLLYPCNGEECAGMTVKAVHTIDVEGMKVDVEHIVELDGKNGYKVEEEYRGDSLKMCVLAEELFFTQSDELECADITGAEENLKDNLVITAPYIAGSEDRAKVFGATQCEWFGGSADGIAGGTRLFLGGNTEETNKNLVVWSDLNNPLYFPENNYFRVGENSSAVTGFGKQSDMLVIFKENGSGIYYTKYQQNTEISAEDLINQSVVDYAASSVYFPLVQVNPNVGCSYPETIQLCRNRLVWLGDNGNVYTLVNESQYNERSVFCVSEMVRRDLRKNGLETPTACDWEGYYCLMYGDSLYLMDYNCYGYTHVVSFSKSEDANIRIPWYIWELPRSLSSSQACEIDGAILFSNYNNLDGNADSAVWNYLLTTNNVALDEVFNPDELNDIASHGVINHPIQTGFRTKFFDFGEPNKRKSVDKINLQLGNNGGERITVKVITDQSEEEHDIYLRGTQTEAYTPGYIDSKAIFPCARNVLRVGLEISSEGVVAVDGMEIKYRTLQGGAR